MSITLIITSSCSYQRSFFIPPNPVLPRVEFKQTEKEFCLTETEFRKLYQRELILKNHIEEITAKLKECVKQ